VHKEESGARITGKKMWRQGFPRVEPEGKGGAVGVRLLDSKGEEGLRFQRAELRAPTKVEALPPSSMSQVQISSLTKMTTRSSMFQMLLR
jgi:hypothetical protein